MKNIFAILKSMFSSQKETANTSRNGDTDDLSSIITNRAPEKYIPNANDIRIIAGNATLIITDDKSIGGLWVGVSNYNPCSGSEQECFDAMRNLISSNFEEACESLIFKLDENLFILNIADCQNRWTYDKCGTLYFHLCEYKIGVFYPIIRNFIETNSIGKKFGVTICFGGGTSIGLRSLVNKLKEDGFSYYVLGTTLPFHKKKEESVSEMLGKSIDNFEWFDCTPYIDKSKSLKKFYEEDVEVIFNAMKAKVKQTELRIQNGVVRPDYTPNVISSLKADEVFVFGSNLYGHHAGGAARAAVMKFGAIWGQGVGLQGQSYAIPTMQGGVETIKPYVDQFIDFAKEHTELFFYVTRIGCGIAGFRDRDIAPLFKDAMSISNVCLPKSFIEENKNAVSPEVPQELLTMMYGQVRTLIDLLKALNKQEPIKNRNDARERLTEIAERNVRYGDEFAFMAMRTIWCIMSRYEHEGSKVDIEQLEKDMLSFHDGNEYLKANHIEQIFYNYSVRKMVKYIQFLNEFRRYSDYESIREDLQSIPVNHCSSNDPQYYYSFNEETIYRIWVFLCKEWDSVTKNGRLDNDLLEQVAFGRFDNMVKEHGLKETIRLAYGELGCHPDIQAPYEYENERIWGPVYRIDGKHIEKGCSYFRRWPWTNTSFEMRFAREILERDQNYMCADTDWRGTLYLPISDYTLPVYSQQLGKMHFGSQEDKIKFIEEHKVGRNAD